MLGCQVCSRARPGFSPRPARPGAWYSSRSPLRGARIAIGEADIGIDHADEFRCGALALRRELRADHEMNS